MVVEVLDNIYQHSDCQEVTMGIYLDLQKPFDTVNHTSLIKKIEIGGIREQYYSGSWVTWVV